MRAKDAVAFFGGDALLHQAQEHTTRGASAIARLGQHATSALKDLREGNCDVRQ